MKRAQLAIEPSETEPHLIEAVATVSDENGTGVSRIATLSIAVLDECNPSQYAAWRRLIGEMFGEFLKSKDWGEVECVGTFEVPTKKAVARQKHLKAGALIGGLLVANLFVFGVMWASTMAYSPETFWTGVTVFMAAYGLFVFVNSIAGLVMDLLK